MDPVELSLIHGSLAHISFSAAEARANCFSSPLPASWQQLEIVNLILPRPLHQERQSTQQPEKRTIHMLGESLSIQPTMVAGEERRGLPLNESRVAHDTATQLKREPWQTDGPR